MNTAVVSSTPAPPNSILLAYICKSPVPFSLNIVLLPSCEMEKSEDVPTLIAAPSLNTKALSD